MSGNGAGLSGLIRISRRKEFAEDEEQKLDDDLCLRSNEECYKAEECSTSREKNIVTEN